LECSSSHRFPRYRSALDRWRVSSAHRGDQRIIFELSSQEFVDFSEKLQEFGLSLERDITFVIQDAVIDDLRIRQALTDKEPNAPRLVEQPAE